MAILTSEKYQSMTSDVTQNRINTDEVKLLLEDLLAAGKITQAQAAACFKDISFEVLKITRKDGTPPKEKWVAPKLGGNVTPEGLLDMLGDTREKKADIEKDEKFLAEAFKARVKQREAGVKEVVSELEQQAADPATAGFSLWDNKGDSD